MPSRAVVDLLAEVRALSQGDATLPPDWSSILSTGQRRPLLARALCRQPRLLLRDDVAANLNPVSARKPMRALLRVPAATVFATHSRHLFPFADRVFRVEDPPIVEVTALSNGAAP